MKRIYFVRHGQTQANVDGYFADKSEPLNDTGLRQATEVAKRMTGVDFDVVVASDYWRAKQTAEAIATAHNREVQVCPEFGEIRDPSSVVGLLESGPVFQEYLQARYTNIENPAWHHEDGESLDNVFQRCLAAKSFLENHEAENICVVSHSVFSRLFASAILLNATSPTVAWYDMLKVMGLGNTGVSLFTITEKQWKLVMWNDHAHFAE